MELSHAEIRQLKAAAQHLEPVVSLGKQGLTADWLQSVDAALASRELIKLKFVAFKTERRALAAEIAARTGSELITVVGHVAVLYRPKPLPIE